VFNPSRLIFARKRRSLSRVALAERSNLSNRILAYYESGERVPPDDVVITLARVLSFPESFFFGQDLDELDFQIASFRSLKNMTAGKRDAALTAGRLAIELSKWIEERFELPAPTLPELRGFDPHAAAQALRAEWRLGERPIKNMVHLLEAHGVRVFSLPVDSASVDAFSVWYGDVPFVFLNQMKSGERSRMDAAHELAHLTLHRHGGPRSREAEVEADKFAGAFLMPAGDVLAHARRWANVQMILTLKSRWSVAAIALVHRLRTLNLLTEWQYRNLCVELSQMGFRRSEKDGIVRENSQVLTKVMSTLRKEMLPRSAVAKDLLITTSELDSLVAGLVMTLMVGGRANSSLPSGTRSGRSTGRLEIVGS